MWPVLSSAFTQSEINGLANTDLKQLLWVTKALIDIDEDYERKNDQGDVYPHEDISLPINLKKFAYRDETGITESMVEAKLKPLLEDLKAREYIPSYGFGLDDQDRILYVNSMAQMVAMGELWVMLASEEKYRQAGTRLGVRFDPNRSCLIFDQKECKISPNTFQYSVCKYMFELYSSGEFVDVEKLCEETGDDPEEGSSVKLSTAALEVNKKTKWIFGFPIFRTPRGQIAIANIDLNETQIKP